MRIPVILAISLVIMATPFLQNVHAQELSIATSSDARGGTFFGEGVLQVIITDPDADDESTVEDVTVDIDADPDSGSQGSLSLTVPETSDSSERFEFYLVHQDSVAVAAGDLDPINSAGVEGDGTCISDCAPFVTFGLSGDLQVESDLYEDTTFDLTVGDVEVTIKYEQDLAEVELDRSSYGSDSFVYIFVSDQDANLNPTDIDEFTLDPDNPPNNDLLALGGGELQDAVTFRETGDNSARFEGRYELGASMTFDSESLVLTLFDKANYGDDLAADENDSDSTDEVSFTIGNSDGTIDVGGSEITWDARLSSDKATYVPGENITITIDDPDSNSNPGLAESVDLEISASNSTASVTASETGPNTGVFKANLQVGSDGKIQGTELDAGEAVMVTFTDSRPADHAERLDSGQDPEKQFTLEIDILQGPAAPSATIRAPSVTNVGSDGPIIVGSQVGISFTIENDNAISQPFVSLIEVRDFSGVTVYLASQSGSLAPDGTTTIEVSWKPEASGDYQVRTFAVSSLSEGIVLSGVVTASATVA